MLNPAPLNTNKIHHKIPINEGIVDFGTEMGQNLNQLAFKLINSPKNKIKEVREENENIDEKAKEDAKHIIESLKNQDPDYLEMVMKEFNSLKISNELSKSQQNSPKSIYNINEEKLS